MSFKSFLGWLNDEGDGKTSSSSKEDAVKWKEKRRDNRIDLIPGKELTVHLLTPDSKEAAATLSARVRNVSMRGCSLVFANKADHDRAAIGTVFVATLAVDEFPIPLSVKVVRSVGPLEVAAQFKPPFPRELDKLEKFLEPRCLGRSLREIDPSVLQKGLRKGLRWFQGVNETSLFSWDDPTSKEIVQQQLVFLESVVEWQEGSGLRTGRVRPDASSSEGDVDWVKSELLDFDSSANPAVLAQAQAILESSKINDVVKKKFLEKLKSV